MEDDYGSNVHARVEKSVRFMECPLWRGFVVRDYLGIHPGQNFLSVLREVSALGRFHCVRVFQKNLLQIGSKDTGRQFFRVCLSPFL